MSVHLGNVLYVAFRTSHFLVLKLALVSSHFEACSVYLTNYVVPRVLN